MSMTLPPVSSPTTAQAGSDEKQRPKHTASSQDARAQGFRIQEIQAQGYMAQEIYYEKE